MNPEGLIRLGIVLQSVLGAATGAYCVYLLAQATKIISMRYKREKLFRELEANIWRIYK